MNDIDLFSIPIRTAKHETVTLDRYRGKVLLIVNVASKCGFTGQYAGLQKLHERFHSEGLEVLAFPCNQFGSQEPGSEAEIVSFCEGSFGVQFPIFEKLEVNGSGAHPLYAFLKSASPGLLGTELIKWNFTKFLVGRDGKSVERFSPTTDPQQLEETIAGLLQR